MALLYEMDDGNLSDLHPAPLTGFPVQVLLDIPAGNVDAVRILIAVVLRQLSFI